MEFLRKNYLMIFAIVLFFLLTISVFHLLDIDLGGDNVSILKRAAFVETKTF